jgi:hypothetical protein
MAPSRSAGSSSVGSPTHRCGVPVARVTVPMMALARCKVSPTSLAAPAPSSHPYLLHPLKVTYMPNPNCCSASSGSSSTGTSNSSVQEPGPLEEGLAGGYADAATSNCDEE